MAGDTKATQSGVAVVTPEQRAAAFGVLGELRRIHDTLRGIVLDGPVVALRVGLQGDDNFVPQAWQRIHTRAIVFRSNGSGNVGIQIGSRVYVWRTGRSGAYTIPFHMTIERGTDVFEPPSGVPRTVEPTMVLGTLE